MRCPSPLPHLSASVSNPGLWRGAPTSVVWRVTKELCSHCLRDLPVGWGGEEVHVLCADDCPWKSTSHSFCPCVLTQTAKHNWASYHTSSVQWAPLVSCSVSTIRFISGKRYSFPCTWFWKKKKKKKPPLVSTCLPFKTVKGVFGDSHCRCSWHWIIKASVGTMVVLVLFLYNTCFPSDNWFRNMFLGSSSLLVNSQPLSCHLVSA